MNRRRLFWLLPVFYWSRPVLSALFPQGSPPIMIAQFSNWALGTKQGPRPRYMCVHQGFTFVNPTLSPTSFQDYDPARPCPDATKCPPVLSRLRGDSNAAETDFTRRRVQSRPRGRPPHNEVATTAIWLPIDCNSTARRPPYVTTYICVWVGCCTAA